MRCIYTEKVCSWEVVGPMGGEWLKEVDMSSVWWRGGIRVYKSCCGGITVLRLGRLGALCHVSRAVSCASIYVVVAARTYCCLLNVHDHLYISHCQYVVT